MLKAVMGLSFLLVSTAVGAQGPAPAPAPAQKLRYAEAQVLVLLAPNYPKDAYVRGDSAQVDVVGTVQGDGTLRNPRVSSFPQNPAFELAVMDVIKHWRFQPRVETPGCGFKETDAKLTIWFEIAGGKPKVSHSRGAPANPSSVAIAPPDIVVTSIPQRGIVPEYPEKLAKAQNKPGPLAQIAYVGVKPDGTVGSVTLAPVLYYQDFQQTVYPALSTWRFAPQAKAWCGEFELQYGAAG